MNLQRVLSQNAPAIFTGLGIASFLTSIVLVAKAAPKAEDILEDMEDATVSEKVIAVAPTYTPAVGMALMGVGCILAANRVQSYRYAALFSLYSFSEGKLEKWQKSVLENVDEKKAEEIRLGTTRPDSPVPDEFRTMHEGDAWFFDELTGRYFVSTVEGIRSAVNDCNEIMFADDWVNVNDLYHRLGLADAGFGDQYGWASENGAFAPRFDPHMEDGNRVIITLFFDKKPSVDFSSL